MRVTILRFSAVVAALALAPSAHAEGPSLVLGATEDAVRSVTLTQTKAQMDLLVLAGFGAVRISQAWAPGEREPSARDQTVLENVAAAAKLANVTVVTSVMNVGSRTTPLTPADQADFAAFAAAVVEAVPGLRTVIVGNEPNLNRYWLPQFNDDGTDAAAPAYESLLALTYDAVKAAAPDATVLGGALAPRGGDVAGGIRPTHSPTVFINDMGEAYRASGRTEPIMDGFAFHPYEDNSSIAPASGTHASTTTIALADYQKLVAALGGAFPDGYSLPIWYDEFGVESQIPAEKVELYSGTEPATTKPVAERGAGRVLPAGGAACVLPAERATVSSSSTPWTRRPSPPGSRASITPTAPRSPASQPSSSPSRSRAAASSRTATVSSCPW